MEQVINGEVFASVNINGNNIPLINDVVVTLWVVSALIIAAALVLTSKMELVPGRRQAVAEIFCEFCDNFAKNQIGKNGRGYAAYLGVLLLLLASSNMISLINVIPSGEFLSKLFNAPGLAGFSYSLHPPTRNFNVTLCFALVSIVLVIHAEFKFKGARGWLRGFYKPMPVFGFVKVLDYIVRPMSLCLRLFGNILGAAIIMDLIYGMVKAPFAYPIPFNLYFDVFDGILQAYVFVFLTSVYLSEAVESGEPET